MNKAKTSAKFGFMSPYLTTRKDEFLWEGGEVGESRRSVKPFPRGEWVRLPPLPPYGPIAQLGEHKLCKLGVKGSIPFGSTRKNTP